MLLRILARCYIQGDDSGQTETRQFRVSVVELMSSRLGDHVLERLIWRN